MLRRYCQKNMQKDPALFNSTVLTVCGDRYGENEAFCFIFPAGNFRLFYYTTIIRVCQGFFPKKYFFTFFTKYPCFLKYFSANCYSI